ncbi:MAG: N-Acetyl-D-glucosamine ABC transport system, sugar-binding protein [Candidatus Carbobacillus altaicus]|uniref:N-Acetyl-D-glucosamine ABC transport system, sugar-binding protein n=1 Tax=Candidatus Carbonibacillus altaicus TaxID=2163959 RepID=A0A2R6Y2L9_9BACL|nr:MAG: N-Acetyl-D-glucosamine ABC transport system, sugar-binding protein [Candidatus Carbobacillus altaicus]
MKKGLSVLAVTLLFVFLLSGCFSNNRNENSQQNVSDGNSGGGTESTEITFLVLDAWAEQAKKVIEAFEAENPDIKVKVEVQPFSQIFEAIEVQMKSGKTSFDVFPVDSPLTTNYAIKGFLAPLDPYFDDSMKTLWLDTALQAGTYNGQLMSAPMNTSSQVLFYNKDLFEQRGVTPPPSDDPSHRWTWEQLVEAAKQLTYDTNDDGTPDIYGFSFDQIDRPYQLLPLGQSLGAEQVISDDGLVSKGYTNSESMVQGSIFYYDLFNTWKVSPKIPQELSRDYFKTGKVAMFLGTTATMHIFKDKINLGVSYHPYFEGKKVVTPTGSWHLGISAYSNKKEAAGKFIQFFSVGKGAEIWLKEYGQIPALKSLLKTLNEQVEPGSIESQVFKIASYEVENTAVLRPRTPGYLEWESILRSAFEDIKNGADPKTALDNAVEIIDKQLVKYKSAVKP